MRKVSTLVGLSLFALAGIARAQDVAPADPAAAPAADPAAAAAPAPEATVAAPAAAVGGSDYVSGPLTVGAGALKVVVPVVLNLSKEAVLKPVWVPLALSYGVNDQLEVFISHTGVGTPIASSGGLCLGGKDRGCAKAYNNVNVGAQFSLLRQPGMELAAIGALEFRRISDPMNLAIDVGVNFKYYTGPIAVRVTPVIGIGANKRSEGNKEMLSVPVQLAYQAMPELALFLDTGIYGPTSHFGDLYTVPVGIGASFAVQPGLDVGAEFLLPMVAKGSAYEGIGAADMRMLAVFASYRTK